MAGSDVTPIVAIVATVPRAGDVKTRLCPSLSHVEAGALFATGATAVIALGADAPTLPVADIAEAQRRLANEDVDVVLGPTDDGGYYLIGLRRPPPALFDGIAWPTPAVREQTRALRRAPQGATA